MILASRHAGHSRLDMRIGGDRSTNATRVPRERPIAREQRKGVIKQFLNELSKVNNMIYYHFLNKPLGSCAPRTVYRGKDWLYGYMKSFIKLP